LEMKIRPPPRGKGGSTWTVNFEDLWETTVPVGAWKKKIFWGEGDRCMPETPLKWIQFEDRDGTKNERC